MSSKSGKSSNEEFHVTVTGGHGHIAQLLHPLWIQRNDLTSIANALIIADEQLSLLAPDVKVVVSGAGLIEINFDTAEFVPWIKLDNVVRSIHKYIISKAQYAADALKNSCRDYIIGVDAVNNNNEAVGQFAVLISAGVVKNVAWKSYPHADESEYLAGYGTIPGMNSPRIASTKLGKTMFLICNDAQVYNHRKRAKVCREPRKMILDYMANLMETERPQLVLSLIHRIEKPGSITPFRTSYMQIHSDYDVPATVGAFGYDERVSSMLMSLADKAQYPDGKSGVIVILSSRR